MRKEQSGRNTQPQLPSFPSIRDYWNNPTGPLPVHAEPLRRKPGIQRRNTPSLWEARPFPATPSPQQPATLNQTAYLRAARPLTPDTPSPVKQLQTRVEQRGVSSLSTVELLRIAGVQERDMQRVEQLLKNYTLPQLLQVDFGEFSQQYGFGKPKAAHIQAVLEVARRLTLQCEDEKYLITSPADAARLLAPEMEYLDHEEMRVLLLNTKNGVMANMLLYQGTINSSVCRAAEIFRPAVARKCHGIVLAHNHPSGDPTPSPEDISVTKQLVEAGKVLDVDLVDHLVIGNNSRFVSLKERLRW